MKITAHTKSMNKTLVNIIAIVTALSLVFLQTPIFSFARQARADAAAEVSAQVEETGSVDVKFSFDHAYVMVDGQVLAPPASKVTVPADSNLVFTADADSGYEIDTVEATIGGSTTTLSPDGSGQYEISASSLVDGKASVRVKAIAVPEPEPEVVEEEAIEEEAVEEQAAEERAVEQQAATEEAAGEGASGDEAVEGEATTEETADGQAADQQEADENASAQADAAAIEEDAGLTAGKTEGAESEKEASKFEYSDSNVKVVATLADPTALPEGVEFVVTPVTAKTDGYNYDAYMEALNKDAEQERTVDNTLLYDVAFMLDGKEVTLAEGVANITFQFKDKQLTDDLNATSASDVEVIHLPLSDAAKKGVDSTADAIDITAKDIDVEPIRSDTTLKGKTQKTEFTTEGFSVYGITVGTAAIGEAPADAVTARFEKVSDSASGNGPAGSYEFFVALNHGGQKYFVLSEALDTAANNTMEIASVAFGQPYSTNTAAFAQGDTLEAYVVSNVDVDWKAQKILNNEDDPWNFKKYGDGDVIDGAWRVSISIPENMKAPSQNDSSTPEAEEESNETGSGAIRTASADDDTAWDGGSSIDDIFNNVQGEEPAAGHDTYDTILGNAVNFGIVTNVFSLTSGDAQTNVAAKTGTCTVQTGNDMTNDVEQTFILANVNNVFKIKGYNAYVLTNSQDASKVEPLGNVEMTLDTSKSAAELESAVQNMLSHAESQSSLLASRADNAQLTYRESDQKYYVSIAGKGAGTYYVTLDDTAYANICQADKLRIEKDADQTIVFNVTANPSSMQKYSINGSATDSFTNKSEASSDMIRTIVWNFKNADGNISIDGPVAGVMLAPKATITVNGTSAGWLVANNVTIGSGEWHNVDQRVRVLRIGSSATFKGIKQVNGVDSTVDGFEFELFYKNGDNWESLGTTTNSASSITFDSVNYNSGNFTSNGNSQDYIYKIVEKQGPKTIDGTVYNTDSTVYYAKVTVNKVTKKKGDTTEISYNATAPTYYSNEACTKAIGGLPTFNNTSEEQPEKTSVSVRKAWVDANNQDGKRPDSITVKLLANGTDTGKTVTLNAQNNWSASWSDLPKKDNGADIAYTVQETQVSGYQAPVVSGNAADGFVITNTRTPEVVSIPAEKIWDDANNQDGMRPTQVTLQLNKNGNLLETVTVTAASSWKHTWTNLPKYENGQEIAYTVSEPAVPAGYTASIDGYKVKNSHTPGKTSITVTKAWDDANNQDGVQPNKITVKLFADGVEKDTAELSAENNWTHTWTDLDQKKAGQAIAYTVDETNVDGYTKIISGDAANGFTITNKRKPEETSISVLKTWSDADNQDGIRPAQVSAQLYADGVATGAAVVLSEANKWSYTWTGLAKNKEGKAIKYTVKETPLNISLPESVSTGYTAEITGSAADGFVITNRHTPEKTSVSATKTWEDNANQDGKRTNTAKLQLMANTGEGGAFVNVGDPVVISKDDSFSKTWNDLPKFKDGNEITYKVVELDVPEGYESVPAVPATNNFTFVNRHNPGKTSVSVVKAWNDKDDEAGLRPSSIEVQLLANGVLKDTTELNANNNWAHTWSDLDEYANGVKVEYTVKEATTVARYDNPVVTGDVATGFVVTNTYEPTYTQASVSKVWEDADDQDGVRPQGVQVILYANGEAYRTETLNEANSWSASWANLPTVIDGEDVVYTIDEPNVPDGYTKNVTNDGYTYTVTNTHIPEKMSVFVEKEWNDADDQDGLRSGATVQLQLMKKVGDADAVAVGDPVTVGTATGWTNSWNDLPKKEGGQSITYFVVESGAPEGYSANITAANPEDGSFAFRISNDYIPGKTSVTVRKAWVDSDDFDGLRPSSVQVQLYADGAISGDPVELNASNEWTYTWTNLEEKAAGKSIEYTVAEVGMPTGYTVTTTRDTAADNFDYTITNTHTPTFTSASVEKVWNDGDNRDDLRPASIQVQLYANGVPYGNPVVLSQGNWSYEWSNLPTIIGGQNVTYTVGEVAVRSEYASSITRKGNAFTITNTYTPEETSVSATKVWSDDNNRDGIRPNEVTVQLQVAGQPVNIEGVQATVKLNADNNWTTTWSKLPKKAAGKNIAYEVVEISVPTGYTPSYVTDDQGTVTVTNKHTPVTISVSGAKTWNDANNQDGKRPESVTVRLFANGAEKASKIVRADEDGNWNYTFTDLPKNEAGNEIVYTITEDAVTGYTAKVDGFNVTNTHKPETIEIAGTKTWDDSNNQDGKRPTSITVKLMNGETVVDTKTVTEADGWSYVFKNLPKYASGSEIVYTITEDKVEGYNDPVVTGYNVKNSYKTETTEVSGIKRWEDADNQDGIRPTSVKVNLLADGVKVKDATVVADANGNWNYSFTDLPKYNNGTAIVYTVSEEPVDGYTTEISGTTIKNKHIPEVTKRVVQKAWVDANDQDGIRPESVSVTLMADGKDFRTATLSAANKWMAVFDGLPVKNKGKVITYTLREDPQPNGYTAAITELTSNTGFLVTNTHTPEKTSVSGEKTWSDNENQDGKRPESITINLLANGTKVDSKTVTAADGWKWSFTNLDKFKEGQQIVYTVTEDAVANYTSEISGFNVTNKHIPEKTSVGVSKVWDDSANHDGLRPASIQVRLYADGEETDKVVTLGAPTWSAQFTNLDKYKDGTEIAYTVVEVGEVQHYAIGEAQGAMASGFSFTNKHTVEKVSVEGKKTWSDANNQDGKRPTSIKVNLLADGVRVQSKTIQASGNEWAYRFDDLDKYNGNGKEIVYTVTEDAVADYDTSIEGYDITNAYTPEKTSISVSKSWDDADNQDGIRPESITVKLLADGEQKDEIALPIDGVWSYTWNNLDRYAGGNEIVYTLEEEPITGYDASINGGTLVNKHIPEKTKISGAKTWNDADNQDGKRPASITVNLLADGKVIDSKVVTAENAWKYEFDNLPVFANGSRIAYTVEEVAVPEYATTYTSTGAGFDITNTHQPEKVTIGGTKTWDDADNQDGLRKSVTVRLYADGVEVASKTVTAKDNWTYSFAEQPKYKNGVVINYTVKEDSLPGYTTTYDGYDVVNKHTPETVDISGSKTWTDANNQDGIRPASIVVNLLANGEKVDSKTVTPDENGAWAYSFEGKPKFADGKQITYSITEEAVGGYTVEYQGYNAVNTHIPETVDIAGKKTWSDANNQDGKRPGAITVHLLANGTEVDSVVVTAKEKWEYSFTGKPKNANGVPITYTIVEDPVADYSTETNGYDVTNSYTPGEVEISGVKIWEDANNQDGKRPTSVTVHLFADGEDTGKMSVASAENGWKYSFKNLPEYNAGNKIVYTVTEDAVTGYDTEVGTASITNGSIPEKIDLSGSKTWEDKDNRDGKRPASITVHLFANGEEVASKTVTQDDDWAWSFTNLDKYSNGKEITYTLSEDEVADYTTEVNGLDVTNTHIPEKTSVSGAKTWDDADNQDGKRPESITVHLLANGAETELSKTVTAADGWAWTFENLGKYVNGQEIVYTVTEEAVEGYGEPVYDGMNVTNRHIPEKTSVSGAKTWDDADNQDGKRPESITVHLLANGADTGKFKTVTVEDGWAWTFSDLDKYANGSEITYTVSEDAVAGYSTVLNGMNVTNSYTPSKTSLAGTKEWDDSNNKNGKRPSSITVHLLKDGQDTGITAEATAENNWQYSFTDLDEYENGRLIQYTVAEDEVSGYVSTVNGSNVKNSLKTGGLLVSKTVRNATKEGVTFSFTVTLEDKSINGDYGDLSFKDGVATFNLGDGESVLATGLPSGIGYTVTEQPKDGYTATYSGNTGTIPENGSQARVAFTNTYNATAEVEFKAVKTLSGAKTLYAEEFDFELLKDGAVIQPVEGKVKRNAADGTVQFDKIEYKLADVGKTYKYTIREVVPENAVETDDGHYVYKGVTYDTEDHSFTVTVSDNGNGTLNLAYDGYNPEKGVAIKNKYESKGVVALSATKSLDGKEPGEREFSFQLWEMKRNQETGQNEWVPKGGPVKSNTHGLAAFPEFELTTPDPRPYLITEVVPEDAVKIGGAWVYDNIVYGDGSYKASEAAQVLNSDAENTARKVTVVGNDNFDGTIVFTATYEGGEQATFDNTSVTSVPFTLSAKKTMEGRDFQDGDTFTFEVAGTVQDGDTEAAVPMPHDAAGKAVDKVTIEPKAGEEPIVNFGTIDFTANDLGNTYRYTVSENELKLVNNVGVESDKSHTVDVTVVPNGTGAIDIQVVYDAALNNGADEMVFTNKYKAKGDTTLQVSKALTGRDLEAGEFSFKATLKRIADADGEVAIAEDEPARNVASASADADGVATFKLEGIFDQDDAGRTFTYEITEVNGEKPGVTYDASAFEADVKVVDNGDGTLGFETAYYKLVPPEAEGQDPVRGDAAPAAFANEYKAEDASIDLEATKKLANGTLSEGQFTFTLVGTSENAEGVERTASNDADGKVAFGTLTYDKEGTYEYEITEDVPAGATDNRDGTWKLGNVVYDGTAHKVVVTVADDPRIGELTAKAAYDEEGATSLTITNAVELARTGFVFDKYCFGKADTFDFELVAANADATVKTENPVTFEEGDEIVDNGTSAFKLTAQNGVFVSNKAEVRFPEISYAANGDYYYLVYENGTSTADMVVDETQYLVHVKVENGKAADPEYTAYYNGAPLGKAEEPAFYNNMAVTLGFNSLSAQSYLDQERVSVYPKVKKYLNGKTDELVGGDFQFELVDKATGKVLATATNDETGDVAFFDENTDPGLAYDAPGTFSYVIREIAGDMAGVTYDKSEIELTVNVTQTDDGLQATTLYNGPAGSEPAFYNTKEGMDVTVQKVSRSGGEGLEGSTYALWMVGEGGDVLVQEATSDAQGYITFKDVNLAKGQKYYLKEVSAPSGHTVDPYRTAYFALNGAGDALVLAEETAADGWHSAEESTATGGAAGNSTAVDDAATAGDEMSEAK